MGRGDKKSRKGKIFKGSFGNSRRKKKSVTSAAGAGETTKAKKAPRKKAEA